MKRLIHLPISKLSENIRNLLKELTPENFQEIWKQLQEIYPTICSFTITGWGDDRDVLHITYTHQVPEQVFIRTIGGSPVLGEHPNGTVVLIREEFTNEVVWTGAPWKETLMTESLKHKLIADLAYAFGSDSVELLKKMQEFNLI